MTERTEGKGTTRSDLRAGAISPLSDDPPDSDATDPAESEATPVTETLLPHVTIWPAAVALGATLFFAGLIANLALIGVGAALFALGLFGWIQEMRHEHE
jgi:hypothetical protein